MRIGQGSIGSVSITGTPDVNVTDRLARLLGMARPEWRTRIAASQGFYGTFSLAASAGNFSHAQLLNPAASGKTVTVRRLLVSITAAANLLFRNLTTALASTPDPGINLRHGAAAPVGLFKSAQDAGVLGTAIGVLTIPAATMIEVFTEWGPQLDAAQGLVLVPGLANIGITTYWEWEEQ
jgi:hypothetical protein